MSTYNELRAAMIADGYRLGWHQHGDDWVHGLGPGEGCAPCDAIDAHWAPQLHAAPLTGEAALAHARRQRIAAAAKLGIGSAASTPRRTGPDPNLVPATVTVVRFAPVPVPDPQPELRLVATVAPLRADDDIDEEPPTPDPPPINPAPAPTFSLSHPTAESIRRHRRKR